MATRTARQHYRNDDIKKRLPLKENIDSVEKVESTLHKIERKGLENAATAAGKYYDTLQKYMGDFPGMAVFIADSEKTISSVCRVSMEMAEFYHKLASDWVLVSREFIGCQSADEFYTLQRMAANQLSKRWLDEVPRLSNVVFGDFEGFFLLPPD